MLVILWAFIGFSVCCITLHFSLKSDLVFALIDKPNHRSLHSIPTPRIGGFGIMVSVACLAAIFSAFKLEAHGSLAALFCCYAALFLISWFDDFWSLSVRTRFSIHILVIFLWVYFNSSAIALLAPKYLFVPACLFLVIGLTWSINLFNFMDGSDGLAGSMCVIGLSAYLACIFLNPATGMVPVLSGLIGATAAFLLFNWPKASIFLGDSGSIPLGFLLGGIGVTGVLYEWWTAQFPLLVFAFTTDSQRAKILAAT
jgi:UDP-N-acetylmuramyl pentapeptide phosphotransferase/UDP-N-acetylglucosamine-1-phosphate transferase